MKLLSEFDSAFIGRLLHILINSQNVSRGKASATGPETYFPDPFLWEPGRKALAP